MSSNTQLQATISTLLRKKVFIMAGITGSGKSTLAKQVCKALNCEYLSSDKIREELTNQTRFDSIGQDVVDQARLSVYAVMYERAAILLKAQKKVVIDATHIEPDKYETVLPNFLQKFAASEMVFITVKTHQATVNKRMQLFALQQLNKTVAGETPYQAWQRVSAHQRELFKIGRAKWPSYKDTGIEVLSSTKVVLALKKIEQYKSIFSEVDHIVWDLDGTLYPPNHDLNTFIEEEKTKRVADHLGVSVPVAQKRFSALYKKLASSTRTLNELGLQGEDFFISIWLEADFSKYIEKDSRLKTLFHKLQKLPKYQIAMLTNTNTQETVRKKLDAIGLREGLFSPIITSVEIGYHKPDHRAFERVLALNKDPNRIMYIGDKEHTDIVPAHKLGMKTCLVVWQEKKDSKVKRYSSRASTKQRSVADIHVAKPHDLISLALLS
jgi:HAD superfamily hydrolase (TIGR01549 family)